jgi:hypothetical protein
MNFFATSTATSFGAHIWNGPNAILNQHIFNVRYDDQLVDKNFCRYAINQTLDEQIAKAHGGVGLKRRSEAASSAQSSCGLAPAVSAHEFCILKFYA